MHPSLLILEEVAQLAQSELELLELEDAAGLSESAAKRNALLKKAWEHKEGCNELDFVNLLMSIQELQRKLSNIAETKFIETRDSLNKQKQNKKAVLGYCKTGLGYSRRPAKIFTKFS